MIIWIVFLLLFINNKIKKYKSAKRQTDFLIEQKGFASIEYFFYKIESEYLSLIFFFNAGAGAIQDNL